jgi:hypothetical protein
MLKVKVKLPLCLIKHFIMKTRRWVEVEHSFLTSALDGGGRPAKRVDRFTPGKKSQVLIGPRRYGSATENFYSSLNVITMMVIVKNGMSGECSMHWEGSNAYNILDRKTEGKISHGRPSRRWENNIKLNEFNLSMQGRSITVFTAEDKVTSNKLKHKSWYQRVQRNKFDCFGTMN